MSRPLTSHKPGGLHDSIGIEVTDEPGDGGANHVYEISFGEKSQRDFFCVIKFQKGPIAEKGPNGVSNEALLAVVEDRLVGFQSGVHSCRENALALTHLQDAMHWLHHRTRERIRRGVEGTSQK